MHVQLGSIRMKHIRKLSVEVGFDRTLCAVFPPEEARGSTRKIEFDYTPKLGSWRIEYLVLACSW
jgi:hypothetical protein